MIRKNNKNSIDPFNRKKENPLTWVIDNKKMVMPCILVICVLITIAIAVHESKKVPGVKNTATMVSASAADSYSVPDEELQLNAYPEVNALMEKYYSAFGEGDVQTIESISKGISDTRKLRIEESAKFIESIPTVDVYTKPGPVENSYIAYVYEEIKFKDYETPVPGMESMYVCTADDGSCYINFADDDAATEYIKEVSLQDDVVDLNNKVAAQYNEMIAKDEKLAEFLTKFTNSLNEAVGVALAGSASTASTEDTASSADTASTAAAASSAASASSAVSASASSAASGSDSATAAASTEQKKASSTITVVATDVVNIRSSDSEKSDVLGKTTKGQKFTCLEKLDNGWYKVKYDDGEAYVKSQYFTETKADSTDKKAADTKSEAKSDSTDKTESKSTVTSTGDKQVKTTAHIRKSASTDAEIVTNAYENDPIEVLKVQADGWSKVKYKGKTGYIKTEFLKNES